MSTIFTAHIGLLAPFGFGKAYYAQHEYCIILPYKDMNYYIDPTIIRDFDKVYLEITSLLWSIKNLETGKVIWG